MQGLLVCWKDRIPSRLDIACGRKDERCGEEREVSRDGDSTDEAQKSTDPSNVVQSLTYTLSDVFDAARDLYQTLKSKQRRDYEANLRSRGYRRGVDYMDDGPDGDEEIVMDKAAVLRQFDNGLQDVGPQFAVGDGTLFPVVVLHTMSRQCHCQGQSGWDCALEVTQEQC